LPIGQLDGGHVATAYFGNGYERAAPRLHAALPALALVVMATVYVSAQRELAALPPGTDAPSASFIAIQAGTMWLAWFALLFLMRRLSQGRYHPPVSEEPLPRSRKILFWVVCVSYLLIFMPVPLRINVGAVDASGKPPASAPR
jgi:membrane-associated protease RseP (regulator of RpoE activity)